MSKIALQADPSGTGIFTIASPNTNTNRTLMLPDAAGTLFNQGSIIGPVSQTAGVPTGAIIERGSNANGNFVKFADGTMVCTFTATPLGGTSGTIIKTLPATFINTDYIAVGASNSSASTADNTVKFPSRTTTTITVVCTVNGTSSTNPADVIVIGLWY